MFMEVKKEIKLFFLSVKYNLVREMANPVSFILNVLFMMLNNATFLVQWIVIFSIKSDLGGYKFPEVCLLWGISSATFGLSRVMSGGAFYMSKYIEEGALDPYLVMPRDAYNAVLSSKTVVSALGDFLYGVILSLVFFHSLKDILLIIVFIIFGTIISASFSSIMHSLAFLLKRSEELSSSLENIFITFSLYPDVVFNDKLRFLFYTLIPVAFAVYVPVSVIREFDFMKLIVVILFSVFISLLARFIFYKGLKNYSSSNLMSTK